jgi:hypothetical protein
MIEYPASPAAIVARILMHGRTRAPWQGERKVCELHFMRKPISLVAVDTEAHIYTPTTLLMDLKH